jgi:hypothetical protein
VVKKTGEEKRENFQGRTENGKKKFERFGVYTCGRADNASYAYRDDVSSKHEGR